MPFTRPGRDLYLRLRGLEWTALDQTRRMPTVFLGARRAMQREAQATWTQETQ